MKASPDFAEYLEAVKLYPLRKGEGLGSYLRRIAEAVAGGTIPEPGRAMPKCRDRVPGEEG